ncbi:MAG: transcriptional regulator [Synoicihabitans sp.]
MAHHTKVRRIGNSLGVILPKEILAELQVEEGQALYVSKRPDGGVTLTPRNEEFDRQMDIGRELTKRYRHTLRELAK